MRGAPPNNLRFDQTGVHQRSPLPVTRPVHTSDTLSFQCPDSP
jgi:hypothetical protein